MVNKSKKRAVKRAHKKSWYEKIFTFSILVVILFIVLSVFTIYQITKPSNSVQGTSTSVYNTAP